MRKWTLEQYTFEYNPLLRALCDLGVEYHWGRQVKVDVNQQHVRGSLQWLRDLGHEFREFYCTSYYPKLLWASLPVANTTYVTASAEEIVEHQGTWEYLQKRFHSQTLFVRPDSPFKEFSGRTLTERPTWESLDHGYYFDDKQLTCVVSRAQPIQQEQRYLVVDNQIVSSTSFGGPSRHLAYQVAEDFTDVKDYALDVGLTGTGWQVVEINPLMSADWTGQDHWAVVEALG